MINTQNLLHIEISVTAIDEEGAIIYGKNELGPPRGVTDHRRLYCTSKGSNIR